MTYDEAKAAVLEMWPKVGDEYAWRIGDDLWLRAKVASVTVDVIGFKLAADLRPGVAAVEISFEGFVRRVEDGWLVPHHDLRRSQS